MFPVVQYVRYSSLLKEKDIAKTKFAYSNNLRTGKLCFQQRRIAYAFPYGRKKLDVKVEPQHYFSTLPT